MQYIINVKSVPYFIHLVRELVKYY